jgi:hypothetical protein
MGMAGQETRKKTYHHLEKLNMEELQNLLRQDFDSSDDEKMDMEYISAVIDVIKNRNIESDEPLQFDIETGWKSVLEKLMVEESEKATQGSQNIYKKSVHGRRRLWQVIAAALLVITLFGVLTAQALGYNIIRIVAQWTDDVFSFRHHVEAPLSPFELKEIPPDKQYESIRDVLDDLDISIPVIPNWYPKGFYQTHLFVAQYLPQRTVIDVVFENDDKMFIISYIIYRELPDEFSAFYIKDESPVYEHDVWGITHYIMSNNESIVAVWINGNVEVSIQGDITKEELLQMINLIYGGEIT